jgi:hypothetical protein
MPQSLTRDQVRSLHQVLTSELSALVGNHMSRYADGLEGTEFPLGTPRIMWTSHGIETYIPNVGYEGQETHLASIFQCR